MGEIKGDSKWVRSKERVGVCVGTRRWGASEGEIEREKGNEHQRGIIGKHKQAG